MVKSDTTQAVDKFAANLTQNVTNNLASAVVSSAINGKPLNEETLTTALTTAFITAGMAQTANSIGAAATGDNPALNAYTQAMAHALAGCVGGAATTGNSGGCSAGAVGAVVGELSAKFAMESGMDGAGALKLATTMSAAAGALVGGPDSAAAVNVASQMGANAAANNYLTHAQLQSKQQQLAACKDDTCRKNVTSTWDKVSQSANVRVEDKVLQGGESANLKTMEQLSADMNGLAQYKSGLETQLRNTTDPTQRANLQLQINEADNSMRQVANLGKDTLALLYQQTGNPQYQNAYQALTAATSGNEIAGALTMPGGAGGNINKAVQETKSGAQIAQTASINSLADEAKAANSALSKTNSTPADSSYVAPAHTSPDKFQTHGLTTDQVPASIVNQLTKDLEATFGVGVGADRMTKELINSGS